MQPEPDTIETNPSADPAAQPPLSLGDLIRAAIAGLLMGVANLIPGVSGGTMILAMGVYQEFIDSIADVSALRFSRRRIVFLGVVGLCAAVSIVALAGVILYLLFHHTIAMFALFIGLTLGGAPLLLRELRFTPGVIVSLLIGFGLMFGVSQLKAGAGFPHNAVMDFVSGVVGSTTMVLPGISGSYMLLVLDQYDRVVGAVRDLKDVLKGEGTRALGEVLTVVIPVGIGVVLGIVGLSNLLKVLLHRYHQVTVAALLGILLGSVFGLWPFAQSVGEKALEDRSVAEVQAYIAHWQLPVPPTAPAGADAETLKEHLIAHVTTPEVWRQRTAPPITAGDIGLVVVMIAVGFAATAALSRLGSRPDEAEAGEAAA